MTLSVRRVVTGHDSQGNAIVKYDGITQNVRQGRPGAFATNIWTTSTSPANNSTEEDAGDAKVGTTMPGGSVFRVIDFQPGVAARMHRTDSVDYIVVMKGSIDMALDNGVEVHLKEGDVMVQRGTIHNWINRGTEACRIAVVLVHADSAVAGGKVLAAAG